MEHPLSLCTVSVANPLESELVSAVFTNQKATIQLYQTYKDHVKPLHWLIIVKYNNHYIQSLYEFYYTTPIILQAGHNLAKKQLLFNILNMNS